ncbi:MAG: bifunctional oligoribonuclease and phosphatase NrnA [Actinomycetota bacterium]|nr:bifunctional oligoribonuclease and phosphatase NrnA [Actinomycetota bacterium]
MTDEARDWDGAAAALRDAQRIGIACHVNPDGDALGSLFAAALALKESGKTVYPSWGSHPVKVPFAYSFLPGVDLLVQPEDWGEIDVFLALDCGNRSRLGSLEEVAKAAPISINVDHHSGNDEFGDHNIVITTASSTAELLMRLLIHSGADIDVDVATCLYTGIVTDTGRFSYSNSSPETLRLAADLLALGVDAPKVAQEVFESSPFGYMKLVGRVLDRAVLHAEERLVYSWITKEDLAETGIDAEETEKLIDLVRSTRDADAAGLFKEQSDGAWRVSLRSRGPRSVGELARARGGGGHELAAGFTAPDIETTVKSLLEDLRNE